MPKTDNCEKRMQTGEYLARIGYTGKAEPTAGVLSDLQYAHLQTVPYENLDILRGLPLSLKAADLYDKIVRRHRGGYCFELNGIFGWLLRELGYEVTDYMARFLLNEPTVPMRRHRVLRVRADGRDYLCDVGVGLEVPRRPLLLQEGFVQEKGLTSYKLTREPFFGWVLRELYHGSWRTLYAFTEEEQLEVDFIQPTFYCENHPDSIFRRQNMLSIRTPDGRKTLDGNIFKVFSPTGVQATELADGAKIDAVLREHFGIVLP